jgi:pyruvate dehydrogenase E1 component alpha subunit/2-oxoisovalerate dehydrogenase E1 component alpha subunit
MAAPFTILDAPAPAKKGARAAAVPGLRDADFRRMFEAMVRVRALDERGLMSQRQGRIGFYVPSSGEEGHQVGAAYALEPGDWCFPSYRVPGVALFRGATVESMVANLFGNRDDFALGRQMPNHYTFREQNFVSISSPLGTQIPQAVGVARAMQIRGEKHVAAVWFGDGTTSEGDFHVAMNFAGVWKAPCVFLCNNNQWAISVPLSRQTASDGIAVKAEAYGFEGVAVDGNDVLAVHQVVKRAVDKARDGGGPTLVEAITYRMGPHSSSDDPTRYRPNAEVEAWRKKDPIERFRRWLLSRGVADAAWMASVEEAAKAEVAEAFRKQEHVPPPALGSLFDDVFAGTTPALRRQREFLEALEGGKFRKDESGAAFPL